MPDSVFATEGFRPPSDRAVIIVEAESETPMPEIMRILRNGTCLNKSIKEWGLLHGGRK